MLKPPTRRGDGDGFIHDPFPDVEVGVDPFLDVFVVGYLVGVETGAGAQMGVVSLVGLWGRGVGPDREGEVRGGEGEGKGVVWFVVWMEEGGREYGVWEDSRQTRRPLHSSEDS